MTKLSRKKKEEKRSFLKTENEKFTVEYSRLYKTMNLVISRCCIAEDGEEVYQNFQRTCRVIVLPIKAYCLWRTRCRHR